MQKSLSHSWFPPFTRQAFTDLASYNDLYCISAYFGLNIVSDKVYALSHEDIDNCLADVSYQLRKHGISDLQVRDQVREVLNVLHHIKKDRFWGKGLTVFISQHAIKCFILPARLQYRVYVGDHFYLQPIAHFFNRDNQYFLIYFNKNKSRVFFVRNYRLHRLMICKADGMPQSAFLNAINKRLQNITRQSSHPLVLAGNKTMIEAYRKINTYSHLYPISLNADTSTLDFLKLKKRVWQFSIALRARNKRKNLQEYLRGQREGQVSTDVNEIVTASARGLVDTLFIRKQSDIYGDFDSENDFVIAGSNEAGQTSLTNIAATRTILNNGNVFLLDANEMPVPNTNLSAILNYTH